MNAADYLRNQGWRGSGYSLDPTDRGIRRPLLVAHKSDSRGLGSNKHAFDNEWWLNAWSKSSKSLDKAESPQSFRPLHSFSRHPSLYSSFVKSEPLKGTFTLRDPGVESMARKDKHRTSHEQAASAAMENGVIGTFSVHPAVAQPEFREPPKKSSKKRKHEIEQDGLGEDKQEKKKSKSRRNEDAEETDHDESHEHKGKKKKKSRSRREDGDVEMTDERPENHNADDYYEAREERKKKNHTHVHKDREHLITDSSIGLTTAVGGDVEMTDAPRLEANQANGVAEPEQPSGEQSRLSKESKELRKKERKLLPRKVRAEHMAAKAEQPKQNARRNRAREAEEGAAAIARGTLVEKEPSPPKEPGELHPDSIAAMRTRGEEVKLHSPPPPPKKVRPWLDPKVNLAAPWITSSGQIRGPQDLARNNPGCEKQPRKELPYKQEKYIRQKAKRVAKQEWLHWQDVKAHPEDYRPDGSRITERDREVPQSAFNAEKAVVEQARHELTAQKMAKRELKEQMKIERRAARKQRRSEKKRKNVELMHKHISAKIQRQKREKNEQLAAEAGMTYQAYIEQQERRIAMKRQENDEKRAAEKGISIEEFQKQREEYLNSKDLEKEARKLGLTVEEYANQAANPEDSELGSGDEDEEGGLKDGTWDTFGRSPIDKLWARHRKQQQNTSQVNGGQVEATNGTQSNDSSDKENKPQAVKLPEFKPPSAIAQETDDFIPFDKDPNTPFPFTIDTTGDSSIVPEDRKCVKDITKEERKARLEAMRVRRRERAEATGIVKMSKKERRRRRAQRKEEMIGRMTHDILKRKRRAGIIAAGGNPEDKTKAGDGPDQVAAGADFVSLGGDASKAAKAIEKKSGGAGPGKTAIKQARREARRIMRGVKKGKIAEDEIPEGWRRGKLNKKPELRGAGGREPRKFREGAFKA